MWYFILNYVLGYYLDICCGLIVYWNRNVITKLGKNLYQLIRLLKSLRHRTPDRIQIEWETTNKKGYIQCDGTFPSPTRDMHVLQIQQNNQIVPVRMILPYSPTKHFVVLSPGLGEELFKYREYISRRLIRHNIASIIIGGSFLGSRQIDNTSRFVFGDASAMMRLGITNIIELQSIVYWLRENYEANICLFGRSMGGYVSQYVACLCNHINIGVVSQFPSTSSIDLVSNCMKKYVSENIYISLIDILKDTSMHLLPLPKCVDSCHLITATGDAYIPESCGKRLHALWKGSHLHSTWGGHVIGYYTHKDIVVSSIVESIRTLST